MVNSPSATFGLSVCFKRVQKRLNKVFSMNTINFEVTAGEFLTVLGPSGSGKSTLLGLVGGWVIPDKGIVEIGGVNYSTVPVHRRPVRTCFQKGGFLFPHLSVEENVAYPLRAKGVSRKRRLEEARDFLAVVDLAGFGNRQVSDLSGGEAQRVSIARAIADPQPVLLLDEIETGLDRRLKGQIRDLLLRIAEERNCTILYVTHESSEALALASSRASRVAVIDQGTVQQVADPESLYQSPATSFVAALTGEVNLLEVEAVDGNTARTIGGNILRFPTISNGSPRYLLIRPETLSLSAPQVTSDVLLGVVRGVEYLGGRRKVIVDVQGDRVQLFTTSDTHVERGHSVGLKIPFGSVVGLER